MYDQMIRNNFYYGYHPLPAFGNGNQRHTPYPLMQGFNGLNWDSSMDSPYAATVTNPYFYPPQPEYHSYPNFGQAQSHIGRPSYSQNIFHNPLHKLDEYETLQNYTQSNGYPYMNPYPKASFLTKPPSGMKSVLNSFKSQDGSLDINKMVDTAGQMMNAVSQVTSVVKGFSGVFKA